MPDISIIVPVYNVGPYLHRCIDSVLVQTFTDFELILVDDGSLDNSGLICDEYAERDKRILVIHQTNQGQAKARNVALDWTFANSDSEYITFIDSDDWVHPQYLEFLYLALHQHDAEISQCKYLATKSWKKPEKLFESIRTESVSPDEQYSNWFSAYFWGKLFQKKCFINTRFPEGYIFEDVLIWYKMLFTFKAIVIVDVELYYYFQRSNSTTNDIWTPAKFAQIEAWENQLAFAQEHGNKFVFQMALRRFCWVYRHQCEEIAMSDRISENERKKYRLKLLRRLRYVVLHYRKELKEIGVFLEYFAWAFPRTNWIYWTAIGILGKFRRSK